MREQLVIVYAETLEAATKARDALSLPHDNNHLILSSQSHSGCGRGMQAMNGRIFLIDHVQMNQDHWQSLMPIFTYPPTVFRLQLTEIAWATMNWVMT